MPGELVRIDLLGPLEIGHASRTTEFRHPYKVTATKPRQVLALLAANAGSTVSMDRIIDELWPDDPPSTVKTIVQTYVHQLRKMLALIFNSSNSCDLLATRPDGYVLAAPRANIDIFRFQHLVDRGRTELRRGLAVGAAELLREALALWRGPIPADLTSGPALRGLAVYLEEARLEAVQLRIEADLTNNRHREIVAELRSLVETHRLHESFYLKLMEALHRSGRRGEALTVFGELRQVLDRELGLKPSKEARRLQHEILVS
ncbi:BTAD domain-containing putative transcriptional regulator [Kitasatospora sp. NPDC056651]|uniref:AfsR/SARP family transcriptional regulator n=1 Tax=Kitasatospora sp. NPDC056651 TaxID=3345892 RepID=UPI0036CAABAE